MRMRWVGVALVSLVTAGGAEAIPVVETDFDSVILGAPATGVVADPFQVAEPPPNTMGLLTSQVFAVGPLFAYVQTVVPTQDENAAFNTEFDVRGFTGVAGWSFTDTTSAGGTGNATDFLAFHSDNTGRLTFVTNLDGLGSGWNPGEPITFFFLSNRPPGFGDYNLLSDEAGTANGLAPVPEPGTLALFGSGLAALYYRAKRRKQQL
jgi:hypothetical protein